MEEFTDGVTKKALPAERRSARRRHEDLRLIKVERELEAARRITAVLFEQLEPDEVARRTLRTALEVVNAESGSILTAAPEARELVFRSSIGETQIETGTAIPWDVGIAGSVFSSGEPVIVDNVKQDKRHFGGIDDLKQHVTVDMIAVPLKRWDGKAIGVLEVLNKRSGRFEENDLSLLMIVAAISASSYERARLDEEAKLAEVAKLLGNISHDIKNLLTPVVCGAETLEFELEELFSRLSDQGKQEFDKRRRKCLNMIAGMDDTSRRIQDRVKEISDCIKGLSSPPRFLLCGINNVVSEVFDTLTTLAQQKGITLTSRGLQSLPKIMADEHRLFNAFYNLVNNAIPEVPPGGTITISGEEDPTGSGVLISVVDTGRGMPPEVRDSLFTAQAMSRKRFGTGLGTKIVKDVVDAHRGRISVKSEVGKGAAFHLFLPLTQEAVSAP
jgi:signal transduction histidine kinase